LGGILGDNIEKVETLELPFNPLACTEKKYLVFGFKPETFPPLVSSQRDFVNDFAASPYLTFTSVARTDEIVIEAVTVLFDQDGDTNLL
jgi:hypothetical protein